MSEYLPYDGLHVYLMSKPEAERHTRLAYNVPPHVGLGWTPYTVLIQSYGATAYKAFHSTAELRQWLGDRFTVKLNGPWRRRGFRSGKIIAK